MDDQTEVPEQYVVLFIQHGQEHASDPEPYKEAKSRADVMDGEEDIQVLSVMTEEGYKQRSEKGEKYRVKYQDAGLPGPSYTRPLTGLVAQTRVAMMRTQDGISDVEIVPSEAIADESASLFRIEGDDDHQRILRDAQRVHKTQQEQVTRDLDSSLDEPSIGAFSTLPEEPDAGALDDWEKALEEETPEPASAKGVVLDSWSHKQNRHSALDHAMKLATMPMGGMTVQISGPSAEKVIENARLFLAFLNEEGTGA